MPPVSLPSTGKSPVKKIRISDAALSLLTILYEEPLSFTSKRVDTKALKSLLRLNFIKKDFKENKLYLTESGLIYASQHSVLPYITKSRMRLLQMINDNSYTNFDKEDMERLILDRYVQKNGSRYILTKNGQFQLSLFILDK